MARIYIVLLLYFNLDQITGTVKYILALILELIIFDDLAPVIIDYISIASILDENLTAFEKIVTSLVEPKK